MKKIVAWGLACVCCAMGMAQEQSGAGAEQTEVKEMVAPGQENAEKRHVMGPWGGFNPGMVLEELKNTNPEKYDELVRLRKEDHPKFAEEIRKLMMESWMAKNPVRAKIDELERTVWDLNRQYKAVEVPEAQAVIKGKIEETVRELVDLRIQDARNRLVELEKQLKVMEENREEIVARQVDFFLNAKGNPRDFKPGMKPGKPGFPPDMKRDGNGKPNMPPRNGRPDGKRPRHPRNNENDAEKENNGQQN